MKHFWIKFNHGVEIGAYLAYVGHAKRTNDGRIWEISREELYHRAGLVNILEDFNESPCYLIDSVFRVVGTTIGFSCRFAPLWSLDLVARVMECFAIFNYNKLAIMYPKYAESFLFMSRTEKEHELYFKGNK